MGPGFLLDRATVRRARNGERRLAPRDAQGRHVQVNLSLAASPALRAAVPNHRATGFDETFRALLAG